MFVFYSFHTRSFFSFKIKTSFVNRFSRSLSIPYKVFYSRYETHHEKTGFLHMRKQRRRSAVQFLISAFVFHYSDSTIPLLLTAKVKNQASVTVQADLCQTWSETPKIGFLTSRLIWYMNIMILFDLLLYAPVNSYDHTGMLVPFYRTSIKHWDEMANKMCLKI